MICFVDWNFCFVDMLICFIDTLICFVDMFHWLRLLSCWYVLLTETFVLLICCYGLLICFVDMLICLYRLRLLFGWYIDMFYWLRKHVFLICFIDWDLFCWYVLLIETVVLLICCFVYMSICFVDSMIHTNEGGDYGGGNDGGLLGDMWDLFLGERSNIICNFMCQCDGSRWNCVCISIHHAMLNGL